MIAGGLLYCFKINVWVFEPFFFNSESPLNRSLICCIVLGGTRPCWFREGKDLWCIREGWNPHCFRKEQYLYYLTPAKTSFVFSDGKYRYFFSERHDLYNFKKGQDLFCSWNDIRCFKVGITSIVPRTEIWCLLSIEQGVNLLFIFGWNGFSTVLDLYDFGRRRTCSGSTPDIVENAAPPQPPCGGGATLHRHLLHHEETVSIAKSRAKKSTSLLRAKILTIIIIPTLW